METSFPSSDRWMWPVSGVSVVLAVSTMVPPLSVITTSTWLPDTVCPSVGRTIASVAVEAGRAPEGVAVGVATFGRMNCRGSVSPAMTTTPPTTARHHAPPSGRRGNPFFRMRDTPAHPIHRPLTTVISATCSSGVPPCASNALRLLPRRGERDDTDDQARSLPR